MAITETCIVGKIEVLESDHVQVRTDTVIEKDGVEIHRTYHRHVLAPGDDLSEQDSRVQAVAKAVWSLLPKS